MRSTGVLRPAVVLLAVLAAAMVFARTTGAAGAREPRGPVWGAWRDTCTGDSGTGLLVQPASASRAAESSMA